LIRPHDLDLLAERCAGKPRGLALMRFLADSSRYYFELMERWRGGRYLVMHDPLALAVALDPTLVETRRCAVDVELSGALTRGMTVADWRGQWNKAPNVEVAVKVDAERFRGAFLAAMERLAGG
jgi:inosine-uridine nucleoside N-ribohydrolase